MKILNPVFRSIAPETPTLSASCAKNPGAGKMRGVHNTPLWPGFLSRALARFKNDLDGGFLAPGARSASGVAFCEF